MEKKHVCENKCGIATREKTTKRHGFIRALDIFNHYHKRTTFTLTSVLPNEMKPSPDKQPDIERWQHRIAEIQRHDLSR